MVCAVLAAQKTFFVAFQPIAYVAGTVLVGTSSYLFYYLIFNRTMFSEARTTLRR
jgi:hypothetical protein